MMGGISRRGSTCPAIRNRTRSAGSTAASQDSRVASTLLGIASMNSSGIFFIDSFSRNLSEYASDLASLLRPLQALPLLQVQRQFRYPALVLLPARRSLRTIHAASYKNPYR